MSNEYVLWVDVETSGLDPEGDYLLEVAAVLTRLDKAEPLFRFERTLELSKKIADQIRYNLSSQFVRDMHDKSGLWNDLTVINFDGGLISPDEQYGSWDDALLLRLSMIIDTKAPIYLGGSSVHFDRKWLKEYLPQVEGVLSHRHLDLTPIRLLNKVKAGEANTTKESGKIPHRAMADVLLDIAEWESLISPNGTN